MDDLEKLAFDDATPEIVKIAEICDSFSAGYISAADADQLASDVGIHPDNLSYYMEKTAGHYEDNEVSYEDQIDFIVKVADSDESSYLDKCAAVADMYGMGAITDVAADELSYELGLDPQDVNSVFESAYADELDKEAAGEAGMFTRGYRGAKRGVKAAGNKIKEYSGHMTGSTARRAEKDFMRTEAQKQGFRDSRNKARLITGGVVGAGGVGAGAIAADRYNRDK